MKQLGIFLTALVLASPAFAGDTRPPGNGACKAEIEKLCPGVQPGGGRIIDCLTAHRDQLSEACKANLRKWRAHRTAQSERQEDH